MEAQGSDPYSNQIGCEICQKPTRKRAVGERVGIWKSPSLETLIPLLDYKPLATVMLETQVIRLGESTKMC